MDPRFPRQEGKVNHELFGEEFLGKEPPCVVYEKRPVVDNDGNEVKDLYTAWIIFNNPKQYNSYTTEMVKGAIAAFHKASMDGSVVAVIFTGVEDKAFCTGGNTKEYAEYYSGNPKEYMEYMDLFMGMIDGIMACKKPVINRVNGMRVAGGQEIGLACDLTISSDLAVFGQAGPRHGSAPVGGVTDFMPWYITMENALWTSISCEMWSAYKAERLGMISKSIPVLKKGEQFIRNPFVYTDSYVKDGAIVYGELVDGQEKEEAKKIREECTVDFSLLDKEVNKVVYTLTNLFPNCLQMSIDLVRAKKKFFWDQAKIPNRHWLGNNMMTEAYLGFNAFNSKKVTGEREIDFIEYRRQLAQGKEFDQDLIDAVMPKPKE